MLDFDPNLLANAESQFCPRACRWLSRSLYLGAIVDWGAGTMLLLLPALFLRLSNLPSTDQWIYPQMNGLFLLLMGLVYFLIARYPIRFLPLAWLAVGGRASGAVFYAAFLTTVETPLPLVMLCVTNFTLALTHVLGIRLAKKQPTHP